MELRSVSPENLLVEIRSGKSFDLLDVRTPAEYGARHVKGARNIPLGDLSVEAIKSTFGDAAQTLYVVCEAGSRSKQACQKLSEIGFSGVVCDVAGGTRACADANLPLAVGKGAISLDRQVRIAAGTLVVLGALGSVFVHASLVWLAAFVGAGLVFAGVTDTCGMALMLARMPWNKQ